MVKERISVIVPVYNLENYIEKTVTSILGQTYKNLEIILVDDGSKDNTLSVLQKLGRQDSRIKVLHKKNEGVTKARISGIEVASGEWIGFVDGDDLIESDMYKVLLDNAVKYDADISHCGYQMVFPSHIDYYYNTGKLLVQDTQNGVKDLLEGKFIEPGLGIKLFRKQLVDKLLEAGVMDFSIKINEDLLMNYYLFKNARRSIYLDKCFYHYILRKGSAATSDINSNKLNDPLKVLKILENETKGNEELVTIVRKRIVLQLINLATMSLKNNKELILPRQIDARMELRKRLPDIWKGEFGIKEKVFSMWVVVWPWSYRMIHTGYVYLTRRNKKYTIE